ncbi:MAG: hypothetical protein CMP49_04360 [Flavobacteriales bacterium]|nr:hypothetical protein [Flavobacteriales bacterium]|tara:strand:- start:423 stop:953 length:531 start_codon:yes stop_codon:yes gene_type:complete
MKTIQEWFDEYGKSHQNKTNKIIHWICIPLIFWSIISLLSLIPHSYLDIFNNDFLNGLSHWGTIVILLGLTFYLRLSLNIFLGMFVFSIFVLIDIYYVIHLFDHSRYYGLLSNLNISSTTFLLYISIFVFVFAWVLQFIGHKIEGKKPSFLKDIQFLLIGPAWLLGFIYKKFNINY